MASEKKIKAVVAPISGVFYKKPAPEEPEFVTVGSKVKDGDTLCLLETMKVFTRVKSSFTGVVTEVLVEDAATVEKNQVLFKLET